MKTIPLLIWALATLTLLSGCAVTTPIKQTIGFTAGTVDTPVKQAHLGVVLADDFEKYSVRSMTTKLPIGQVVSKNIGAALGNCFKAVTVSTNISTLPSTVDNVAVVRFAPGSDFHIGGTIFNDTKVTVVLNFKLYDKSGKELKWETTARGEKAGKQPPNAGLLFFGVIQEFWSNLSTDAIQACLTDLNGQISTKGLKAIGAQ